MHTVELYRKVRLACRDGMSERAAALNFGISRESVKKLLRFSEPPGYRRRAPVRRPKLDGFTEIIDQWLKEDLKQLHKQRHTAKRISTGIAPSTGFGQEGLAYGQLLSNVRPQWGGIDAPPASMELRGLDPRVVSLEMGYSCWLVRRAALGWTRSGRPAAMAPRGA